MIDFDSLVLGPCMNVFARPIIVTPAASQPLTPVAYTGRGIWSSKPVDIPMEDGIMSSQEQTLSLKASEFLVPPGPGDKIEIPAEGSFAAIGKFVVEDVDDDGQGGLTLSLKTTLP